jgi:hypothetical protein
VPERDGGVNAAARRGFRARDPRKALHLDPSGALTSILPAVQFGRRICNIYL